MKYRNGETPLHVWETDHDTYRYVSMDRRGSVRRHYVDGHTWNDDFSLMVCWLATIETDQPELSNRWTSVITPPESMCDMLTYAEAGFVVAFYSNDGYWHESRTLQHVHPLYWMELPAAPTETDQPEQPPAACSPSPIESNQVLEGPELIIEAPPGNGLECRDIVELSRFEELEKEVQKLREELSALQIHLRNTNSIVGQLRAAQDKGEG